jgi:type IV secretory pathway VirB4 component
MTLRCVAFPGQGQRKPAQSTLPGLDDGPGAEAALWEFESQHADILRDLIFTTLGPDQHLRLSALKEHLEMEAMGPERDLCLHLATLLEPYCGDGMYGALFDRPTNISLSARVVHFELGQIPESASELKSLIAFLIMNQIRQHLITLPRHLRKMLMLEELSRFLAIAGAEKLVRELYEQMRKTNTLVISILQQYSRLTDPSLRAAIVGNSPTFFIFNPGDRTDLALLASEIGLSNIAQETILRYVRPAQLAAPKYSEFMYFHTDPNRPVCGTVRHIQFTPPAEAGLSVESVRSSNP